VKTQLLKNQFEIVAFLERCLPNDDVQLQVSVDGSCLLVVFNLAPLTDLTYDSLAQQLLDRLVEVTFPNLNSLTLQGRSWGDDHIEWQMELALPLVRQNPGVSNASSATRLVPLIQKKYRNVMEELVADEVKRQTSEIEDDYVRECLNSNQAIAYALNRLQPMYATTESGWLSMRKYALNNGDILTRVVAQAVKVVSETPRAASDNLYRNKPRTSAQILARLTKLMGKNSMRWRDLPDTLQRKLDKNHKYRRQNACYEIRSYLKRSKLRELTSTKDELYLVDFGLVETDWFKVYMSAAIGDYLNVLEQVVYDTIANQLAVADGKDFNIDEVIAYSLNRLPTMYATSETGIQELRQLVVEQMQERINDVVKEAIERVSASPRTDHAPLPFALFERELEFALREIRQMLDRSDITWENLDEVLKAEFEQRDITIPLAFQN
jgi:hypothetical protein